jgi:hypothetical protein
MPFYRYTVQVALSPEQVRARIGAITRSPSLVAWLRDLNQPIDGPVAGFVGRVGQASFRVRPNVRLLNHPVSVINGYVLPTPTGSTIAVTVRMSLLSAVLLLLSGGIVAGAFWGSSRRFGNDTGIRSRCGVPVGRLPV